MARAPAESLFNRLARCRPSNTNSTALATDAGDSLPSNNDNASCCNSGTCWAKPNNSLDDTSSPVLTTVPDSNAVMSSLVLSPETRRLYTCSTAPRRICSNTAPSRPSSTLSISILPAVEATSASRSLTRGATTVSPARRPRRTALAASSS